MWSVIIQQGKYVELLIQALFLDKNYISKYWYFVSYSHAQYIILLQIQAV